MPWCDPCERFFNPNTVQEDGTCPQCGTKLAEPVAQNQADEPATGWRSVPWHFWLVIAALVVYLGWRAVQGVLWVIGRF